nr:MAG TPA: hypothetical protein [Caudoviricetes sp.]
MEHFTNSCKYQYNCASRGSIKGRFYDERDN